MMSFQTGGPQFKIEPYVTADDITEAADMLGRGIGVALGGNPIMPQMPNMGGGATTSDSQSSDPLSGRMDQELLPGKSVFGIVQVQATARSATMQQQSAMLNSSSSVASGSAAPASNGGAWSQPILFYADGTTSNAVVSITLDGMNQVLVKIRGLTGETDVTEVLPL